MIGHIHLKNKFLRVNNKAFERREKVMKRLKLKTAFNRNRNYKNLPEKKSQIKRTVKERKKKHYNSEYQSYGRREHLLEICGTWYQ